MAGILGIFSDSTTSFSFYTTAGKLIARPDINGLDDDAVNNIVISGKTMFAIGDGREFYIIKDYKFVRPSHELSRTVDTYNIAAGSETECYVCGIQRTIGTVLLSPDGIGNVTKSISKFDDNGALTWIADMSAKANANANAIFVMPAYVGALWDGQLVRLNKTTGVVIDVITPTTPFYNGNRVKPLYDGIYTYILQDSVSHPVMYKIDNSGVITELTLPAEFVTFSPNSNYLSIGLYNNHIYLTNSSFGLDEASTICAKINLATMVLTEVPVSSGWVTSRKSSARDFGWLNNEVYWLTKTTSLPVVTKLLKMNGDTGVVTNIPLSDDKLTRDHLGYVYAFDVPLYTVSGSVTLDAVPYETKLIALNDEGHIIAYTNSDVNGDYSMSFISNTAKTILCRNASGQWKVSSGLVPA